MKINVEVLVSMHPLQDVTVEDRKFDSEHRMIVRTLSQPGRVIFRAAGVTVARCRFDGNGVALSGIGYEAPGLLTIERS